MPAPFFRRVSGGESAGGGSAPSTLTVHSSDATEYAVSLVVKDSDGTEYTVTSTVRSSDATEYEV